MLKCFVITLSKKNPYQRWYGFKSENINPENGLIKVETKWMVQSTDHPEIFNVGDEIDPMIFEDYLQ